MENDNKSYTIKLNNIPIWLDIIYRVNNMLKNEIKDYYFKIEPCDIKFENNMVSVHEFRLLSGENEYIIYFTSFEKFIVNVGENFRIDKNLFECILFELKLYNYDWKKYTWLNTLARCTSFEELSLQLQIMGY